MSLLFFFAFRGLPVNDVFGRGNLLLKGDVASLLGEDRSRDGDDLKPIV